MEIDSTVEANNRQEHYGKTQIAADRKVIGAGADDVADRQSPLVDRYCEGDPSVGERPCYKLRPAQRKKGAVKIARQPLSESNPQADEAVQYSEQQKTKRGL